MVKRPEIKNVEHKHSQVAATAGAFPSKSPKTPTQPQPFIHDPREIEPYQMAKHATLNHEPTRKLLTF